MDKFAQTDENADDFGLVDLKPGKVIKNVIR